MTPPDYEYLRKLLKDHSGLDLSADKQYLIESRLLPLSRKCGLAGISELVQKMKGGSASHHRPGGRGHDHQRNLLLPRQGAVRSLSRFDHARDPEGARRPQEHPDLVRRRLDRPGAVFAGDVPEGNGRGALPAGGSRSSRPTFRRRCSRNPRRESTASSRSSAACRFKCLSNTSSRTASSGRSTPTFAPWFSIGSSICCTIFPSSGSSTSSSAATC